MRGALAVLALAAQASAIYPDDHWEYSTKLTTSNYKDVIQSTIDAGKTLMAPGWNAAVRAFKDNDDVVFADVNLSEDKVREGADGTPFNPGAGGWPTIRHYNKETGVGGAAYKKKTESAMCDELKKDEYMQAYVEEAAGTALCDAKTKAGCDDQQIDYIDKWTAKSIEDRAAQFARLAKMKEGDPKLKPEAKAWMHKRQSILKQLGTEPDL